MKLLWKPSNRLFYNHICVEIHYPGDHRELCLAGKYGEIWENRSGELKYYLYHPNRGQFKRFPTIGTFSAPELDSWVKLLRISKSRPKMARILNELPDGR
jgi:hypothetical protein